jgi:hypothetical protein
MDTLTLPASNNILTTFSDVQTIRVAIARHLLLLPMNVATGRHVTQLAENLILQESMRCWAIPTASEDHEFPELCTSTRALR